MKSDRDIIYKQLQFAIRPKFSGNVDLRLNRLNLKKIEKIISEVKFLESLSLHD
jgi:hypothetical protein